MTQEIRELLFSFYTQALTVNAQTRPGAALDAVLSPDFKSRNGQETKDRATLSGQLEAFWGLIPDLRWDIQDIIVDGEKAVVRSVAIGSPKGPFMGMELDGSKSFRIDTIDIHTIRDGRIVEVYHLEDWATAMRQLAG